MSYLHGKITNYLVNTPNKYVTLNQTSRDLWLQASPTKQSKSRRTKKRPDFLSIVKLTYMKTWISSPFLSFPYPTFAFPPLASPRPSPLIFFLIFQFSKKGIQDGLRYWRSNKQDSPVVTGKPFTKFFENHVFASINKSIWDRQTGGRTYRRTDTPSYKVARTHLKSRK